MSAIDRIIWDRLAAYGMPAHHAAGILGNFVQESGLRPGIENSIGAYGLAQWLGPRRRALESYAQTQGRPVDDPELQVDFMIHELNGPESRAARALQAAKTPGEAAAVFRRAYERPGEHEANDRRRISAAMDFFNRLSPIQQAEAADVPQGPGVMQPFDYRAWGLVPIDDATPASAGAPSTADERALFDQVTTAQESNTFNPAEWGLVPIDEAPQPATPQPRQMQAFPDPATGTVGDFLSGAGSALARQGQGIIEGLQGFGRTMAGDNPAMQAMTDLPISPNRLALLGATLKRNTDMGQAGEVAGDLAPYLAMSPWMAVPYSAAATPGDLGDRAMAAGGAAVGAGLGAGLARAVRGFTPSAGAQQLMADGVTPTLGQGIEQGVLGRGIRKLEEASTSLPLAGATTRSARDRAAQQWTRAVLGRAEGEVLPGLRITAGGKAGNEAVESLRRSFSEAYDTVLRGQSVPADPKIGGLLDEIVDDPKLFINPDGREWAKSFIRSQLAAITPDNGVVPAAAMKRVSDEISSKGARMLKSQSQQEIDIGRALLNADDVLSSHIEQALPDDLRGIIGAIDEKYANFKRIQRATAMSRNAEGHFTPAELHRSVRMLDTSRDKARFAEGAALLQDLSTAGKAVIPETLGESGTTPRALVAKLAAGGIEGAGLLSDAATYGTLAGLLGAGSREPLQRALLGGYGWQQPTSQALMNWLPSVGAGLGYDFGR